MLTIMLTFDCKMCGSRRLSKELALWLKEKLAYATKTLWKTRLIASRRLYGLK